jgi:hypothetical protein
MPSERFSLRIPECCPQCNSLGTIQLHHIIRGTVVQLSWTCGNCDAEWAIANGDPCFTERRIGAPDRRRGRRIERRRST